MTKSLPTLISTELDKFGVPPLMQLQQSGVVSATITKIIAIDDAVATFHHKMVHHGICLRYGVALAVAADKKAFAAFTHDKRIADLPRPPKDPSETLRCLFNATYPDPKKASKYFKRIEPYWIKRRPVKAVLAFIQKEGLSDTPVAILPGQPPRKVGETITLTDQSHGQALPVAGDGNRSNKPSSSINKDDPPGGSVVGWPSKARVGRTYKLTVKITELVGEATIFEVLEVPELFP